ncbi:Utp14 protein-domain-containing protein [Thelonectria olida]|uniref:Utp14 protein-domain-containing protein n=1 Tax=Thelonectria olida TaxID=1576542 RepID=A0A9P8WAS3_9HYPO|nr:Utp14 protein-domain-containing protein [Thelonectria olida]
MGGRQAHGRSLLAGPKPKPAAHKKSKARSQKNALDAFGIAQENFAPKQKRTPRARELDAEVERKHGRDDEEEEEEEEEEEPQRKKVKRPSRTADDDPEYGSDSEGNEWRLGGLREDDEDSEIESDEAFGESDDEKFEGYTFRGSKPTQKNDDSEDDSQDDEGETLGTDAIDLATALDQFEESSEEEADNKDESGSSDSDDDASDESEEDDIQDDDSEDDEANPEKLEALQGLIAGYGGEEQEDQVKKTKTKISLSDLGLTGINDQNVKKSMKLLTKEEKEKRPGAAKKLDVPLARREQGRIDRSAAYDKTNETMDRWTDTVKQNRRAEHLVFPLPQNSAMVGLDTTEIQPLTAKKPSNELESTIMSIMEQSGLSLNKPEKKREKEVDEEGNELSRKEALTRKRMERELNSREAKRAKRIKKIKSKAYHRVHRKQRERDEMATKEAMEEAGEIDSEAEREAQDRRRALERVGQRHKDSKWAKVGNKNKRAVWDDEFRAGLTEMARRDEELRRRKEGRTDGSDDDTSSDDDSDGGDASLRRQLKELEEDDDEPQSKLMQMKFMQKAEAAKKEANDALIREIRRDLDGEDAEDSDENEREEVGRRQYGAADGKPFAPALNTSSLSSKKHRSGDDDDEDEVMITTESNATGPKLTSTTDFSASAGGSTAGAWSRGETRRKSKKGQSSARVEDLDLTANVMVASRPKSKSKSKVTTSHAQNGDDSDASETDLHLPMAIRDQEMVARAFAGEDVVGDFEREKAEVAEADDDKVIDNTLPGWGSWVGDGVSAKEKKRHQGRFLTKVEGVKKKNRKDAKLERVIINEKRVKKNDQYLASQLPHPFESRDQYERSLRLPVGPEWMTKETFQDTTKPRVLMKQGIIAPISKPMI